MVCNKQIKKNDGACRYIPRYHLPCPKCGIELGVHGTYTKDIEDEESMTTLSCVFRVLECHECNMTHREIPAWLIPYKRFSVDQYCYYYQTAYEDMKNGLGLNAPDLYKAIKMKKGFERLKKDLIAKGIIRAAEFEGEMDLKNETEELIYLAVNNFLWKQQYFNM